MAKVIGSDVKPTFITKPDMRFATTFLSTKYRKYAVNGEAISDKSTGELFMKRAEDGRVVSFHQNKKYMHDLMLELRVLLTNNEGFTYPKESEDAYYLSTDYDLVAINNEEPQPINTDDTIISNGERSVNRLQFPISIKSNGFFCRPMTRDTDKVIVEYLTNRYNSLFCNYTGTNLLYLAEAEKFKKYEKWKDSNIILHYTVTVTYGNQEKAYIAKDFIRFNEEICVLIPYTRIDHDFPNGVHSITVRIDSLEYYKIHFMLQHKDEFDDIPDEIEKFMYVDNNIFVNYFSVMSFVDHSTDVQLLGNEFIIASLDMPYVRRYMSKLAKLKNSSELILSINRPSEDDWGSNTIWAERVRDVYEDGLVVKRGSEVDIKRMEAFLSKKPRMIRTRITENLYEDENVYFQNNDKLEYTADEINHKVDELHQYLDDRLNEAINMVDSETIISGSTPKLYMNIEQKGESGNGK